jgi:hypothetical protein
MLRLPQTTLYENGEKSMMSIDASEINSSHVGAEKLTKSIYDYVVEMRGLQANLRRGISPYTLRVPFKAFQQARHQPLLAS